MIEIKPHDAPSLDSSLLEHHLIGLCDIGNRFVGGVGERAARDFILEAFGALRLDNVRVEEFPTIAYQFESASLELLQNGLSFDCVGLQSTASGSVESEAIFLGALTTLDDITLLEANGATLKDKIVVFQSYWPFALAETLVSKGAKGLVVISTAADGQIGHYTAQLYPPPTSPEFDGRPLAVPGVIVESSAGLKVAGLISGGGKTIRLRHAASYNTVTSANVLAEIPGTESEIERVVIGAHYDTQAEGVGASDNATGVAALLAVANAFLKGRPRRRVVLCAFGNEEGGCWGSMDYCRRHYGTLSQTVGMVNLDALGWAFPAKRALHCDESIRPFALASCSAFGWEPERVVEASILPSTDMNAFIDGGVPACFLWRNPPKHPFYHALGDCPEHLSMNIVNETAGAAAYVAYRLAAEHELDLGRSRPSRRWAEITPWESTLRFLFRTSRTLFRPAPTLCGRFGATVLLANVVRR